MLKRSGYPVRSIWVEEWEELCWNFWRSVIFNTPTRKQIRWSREELRDVLSLLYNDWNISSSFQGKGREIYQAFEKNPWNSSTVPNVKWWFDFGIIYLREDRTRYRPETTRCVTFRKNDTKITIKTRVTDSRIFMLFEVQFQPVSKTNEDRKTVEGCEQNFQ